MEDTGLPQRERGPEDAQPPQPPQPAARSPLPVPRGPHWAWLLPIIVLTFGVGLWVWAFFQANWVRRVDARSRAREWLIASLLCVVPTYLVAFRAVAVGMAVLIHATGMTPQQFMVALNVVSLLFWWFAYFSMSASLRRALPASGLRPRINGVTLFCYTTFYMQAQMNWIRRTLRAEGAVRPVSQLAVWAVCTPFSIAIVLLANIADEYSRYAQNAGAAHGSLYQGAPQDDNKETAP